MATERTKCPAVYIHSVGYFIAVLDPFAHVPLLLSTAHPHIVGLREVLSDELHVYLVLELCSGGELFERIQQRAQTEEVSLSNTDITVRVRVGVKGWG